MSQTSQQRAVKNYRKRLRRRGMARFELVAPADDRERIRSLAKRLAEGGSEATRIRVAVTLIIGNRSSKRGTILAALRRSPLVGAELEFDRPVVAGRELDL